MQLSRLRTYVRIEPRPWRPADELDGALERGDLKFAVGLAEELRIEKGKPIPLHVALRFLPLIARESPTEFDAWALRWLARWCAEALAPSIEQAAEVAAFALAWPMSRWRRSRRCKRLLGERF